MDINKKVIDSHNITEVLGLRSDIFGQIIESLKGKIKTENFYQESFLKWKQIFTNIYGYEISSDLFLKHTYFTHVLKIIFISKFYKGLNFEEFYKEYLKNNVRQIFEYDFFFWTKFDKVNVKKIYDMFHNLKFAKEDLFTNLYQQIFLSDIRHRIGEFFTPSNLVQKMLDSSYKFGLKVLDPSCGSGNFIINIIIKILGSKESIKSKIKAISEVFGFDINPLAVMTVRVNISLLLIEYFKDNYLLTNFNIFLIDSLFPELYERDFNDDFNNLYNSFDLVIGNPPWITYKDLQNKSYQTKIRNLANDLGIKPPSQYITHIELASIFFYSIAFKFLKQHGTVFFVMPKSVLNGDHCHKFRAFSIFNKNLEIWDFPKHYFFNVNHICLKAEYIGRENSVLIQEKYPIKTRLYNNNLELIEKTFYSSLKIENDGAKLLLPIQELEVIYKLEESPYKQKFFQGATLVPRTLVFFSKEQKKDGYLIISSDLEILSRAKKQWEFRFKNKEIEERFHFKTFLNMDMLPFYIKRKKNVFLPVNENLDFDLDFLNNYPKGLEFYQEMDSIYQTNKKRTSKINTLIANLNYWNKLKKQINNKCYIVVYNASGSNLKSAVINNQKSKLIIGSENYYYSTDLANEAYYLAAILNAPILSKYIKLVKSSRHIHKRPFMFKIPLFDEENIIHRKLAKKGEKYHTIVQDLFLNNPKIQSNKVRLIINHKLMKLDKLAKQLIFT